MNAARGGVCALLLLAFALPLAAQQEVLPAPAGTDPRLVRFAFDPQSSYLVLTRPKAVTNIQLGTDEKLVALALGESTQWEVARADGHVFVKPRIEGIDTSATLVTDRRTYQIILRASRPDGRWYQQVSWEYPDLALVQTVAPSPAAARPPEVPAPLDVERLNFDYTVDGSAPFRPTQVMDDGRFTFIRLPAHQHTLPALFLLSDKRELELLNYVVRGDWLMAQQLAPAFVLKLGAQQVTVRRGAGGK